MKRISADQGTLFGPATSTRPVSRRSPSKQTVVSVSADAITAATIGRIDAARVIAEAIHAARPGARNVAVDLGTIRWTEPETGHRVAFATPAAVRDALLALARGDTPEPFRFILGRAARAARSVRVRPAVPPPPG
jgi:hypothetical protein